MQLVVYVRLQKERWPMVEDGVVRFGIRALDEILLGGIPRQNVILVKGSVGTGKTLLGVEFIYRGITQFDEPGIIIVFETSPDKLIRDASSMGWDLAELQTQKKLQIIFTSPSVLEKEICSPDSLLLETVAEIGARRIFVDGVGLFRPWQLGAETETAITGSYRESVHQLIEWFNRENLSAVLSCETGSSSQAQLASEIPEFVADTVIHLKRTMHRRAIHRSIEIVKSRGQNFDQGEHTLQIDSGAGLQVFRRVQAPFANKAKQPSSNSRRSAIGVEALDALLGGGVLEGSTTIVVGVSGVGKTVLGTQLLLEGARKLGQTGLLVSLDEHPAQIVRNAETIGLHLQEHIASSAIHVLFESPQELNIDAHFAKITQTVEKYNIQRMVVDGMSSYSTALQDQPVYRDFFHALVAFSKERLMTTFFNYENPEFLGLSAFMPDFPVSSIVDNIILLSLVEINSSLRRCMTVCKARGSAHQFDSREYVIGEGGITLMPAGANEAERQPFSSYSSILSRAPSRFATNRTKAAGS
ncbi:MAG: ATPase domain-containing protein [Acidobacteriota bacterium]